MKTFYQHHLEGITNKDVVEFINLFRAELMNAPANLLEEAANYFIGINAKQSGLTVLTRLKDIILKTEHFGTFHNFCAKELKNSFYDSFSENSKVNFDAAYNYGILFGNEELFISHECDFVKMVCFQRNREISISLTKLIDVFINYHKNSVEIEIENSKLISNYFGFTQTTFSSLASFCIETMDKQTQFDSTYCLIRCLSIALKSLFDDTDIQQLFFCDKTNKIYQFLEEKIPKHCLLLLLSCYAKDSPENVDNLLKFIEISLNDESSPIERYFGYTALIRITPFISKIIDLSQNVIIYLLRDYDSQNPMLPSTLSNLFKALLKQCKTLKVTNELHSQLYQSVKNLSWHSVVKLLIVPVIIETYPELFNDLIDFAQDPSDYSFVTRCVKTVAKSTKSAEDLLLAIINDAKKSRIDRNMRNVRPLLEPFYLFQNNLIDHSFELYEKIDEKFIAVWLRFESLLLLARSKWPQNYLKDQNHSNLFKDLCYAIKSGNWDLRCAAYRVYSKCSDLIGYDFSLNLKTLMYYDSPKHMFYIEDAFSDFIASIKPNKEPNTNKIIHQLLDILSDHMSPGFVSSHRQFALSLVEKVWSKFPNIYSDKHLSSIVSILTDGSMSLRFLVREKINFFTKIDPTKIFPITSSANNSTENSIVNPIETLSVNKDDQLIELLSKMINENDFEALQELSLILEDKNNFFSKEVLEEMSEKYFDFFIMTKNVGLSYRSQAVFVTLCNKLEKTVLIQKIGVWKSRLLDILKSFDMECMRRSASLPDVALSLIRLHEEDSSHIEIASALVKIAVKTDNETEAVNSLNVIRSILKDKVTSKVEDYLYPLVFQTIFETSLKFVGWDFVAASNLCLASMIHKMFKRSDSSLNIQQFLRKLPDSKDLIEKALLSDIVHTNYLALTVIAAFRKTESHCKSFIPLISKFLSSKSSRIRRIASTAIVTVTPANEYYQLLDQCYDYLGNSRFSLHQSYQSNNYFELDIDELTSNSFHGILITICEILRKVDINIDNRIQNTVHKFPEIDSRLIPPMSLEELNFIYSKLKIHQFISTKLGNFYYDQITSIINNREIDPNLILTDSQLVSLLTKLSKPSKYEKVSKTSNFNPYSNFNSSSFLNTNSGKGYLIKNLETQIISKIESDKEISPLILQLSIDYLNSNSIKFNASKILTNTNLTPEIQASLIQAIEKEDIKKHLPLFIDLSFNRSDTKTQVKISLSSRMLDILNSSADGLIVCLLLLIDDVPLVRTQTSVALSEFLNVDFACEVELFKNLIENKLVKNQLLLIVRKWNELIKSKVDHDIHGDSLTVLVDEFFVIREIFSVLKIDFDFSLFTNKNISESRKEFSDKITQILDSHTA